MIGSYILYICITRNFTCCSDCVKLSNSIVVQDMSLTVCDEEEVENMRHGEASSNMKMKETFPYFCASGILVHRSLPTFCYIADPRNILLLCVSSEPGIPLITIVTFWQTFSCWLFSSVSAPVVVSKYLDTSPVCSGLMVLKFCSLLWETFIVSGIFFILNIYSMKGR